MFTGLVPVVPVPAPDRVTVSEYKTGVGGVTVVKKFATTLVSAVGVRVHGAVPLQAPLQPVKVEREFGVAVSVTGAPDGTEIGPQMAQEIPSGETVISPIPVPEASRFT